MKKYNKTTSKKEGRKEKGERERKGGKEVGRVGEKKIKGPLTQRSRVDFAPSRNKSIQMSKYQTSLSLPLSPPSLSLSLPVSLPPSFTLSLFFLSSISLQKQLPSSLCASPQRMKSGGATPTLPLMLGYQFKKIIFSSKINPQKTPIGPFYFFLRFIFIFRQRGREGEREGKKHQCVVASRAPPTGGLACNPGMCPDWESNQQPFGSQACTQSTEPHQPGLQLVHFRSYFKETYYQNKRDREL